VADDQVKPRSITAGAGGGGDGDDDDDGDNKPHKSNAGWIRRFVTKQPSANDQRTVGMVYPMPMPAPVEDLQLKPAPGEQQYRVKGYGDWGITQFLTSSKRRRIRREGLVLCAELYAFLKTKVYAMDRSPATMQVLQKHAERWLNDNRPTWTTMQKWQALAKAVPAAMSYSEEEQEGRQFLKERVVQRYATGHKACRR